jgi:hypothetical protein
VCLMESRDHLSLQKHLLQSIINAKVFLISRQLFYCIDSQCAVQFIETCYIYQQREVNEASHPAPVICVWIG